MLEADRGLAGGKVLGIEVGVGEGRTYPPPPSLQPAEAVLEVRPSAGRLLSFTTAPGDVRSGVSSGGLALCANDQQGL